MKRVGKALAASVAVLALAAGLASWKARAADESAGRADKKGFVGDIESLARGSDDFRRVLYTGRGLQLALMTLPPGGSIGEETHGSGDQFFRVESGRGEVVIDGAASQVRDGSAVLIPAGAKHDVKNTGSEPLRLYTLYGPPMHRDKTVHKTKEEAESSRETFDGKTTE